MEAKNSKRYAPTCDTPVCAMSFLCIVVLMFGGLIHGSIMPTRFDNTEEAMLFCIPTFFTVLGALLFALEKNTNLAVAGLITALSVIGITCLFFGSKVMMPFVFTFGFIVILLFHFGVNPICEKKMKKWLKGTISEE